MSASLMCLALAIFHESGNQSVKGKQAVAEVVINRVRSEKYPDTVCSVIKQNNQFSWYNKNVSLNNPPRIIYKNIQSMQQWETSKDIARQQLIQKTNHVKGSLFFNTTRLGVRYKTNELPRKIGGHVFY